MCGIMGVVFRDRRTTVDQARLGAARDTMTHRGPDEKGLWTRPGVGLAHRRLSVLDLSNGKQPMVTPDQRHAIVYNGEVYNYLDLQKKYGAQGLSFETRCDTELVFKALNHHGAAALEQFNGMFALGHWDDQTRALLLVRDRLGKKPLYWYGDRDRFVFASELKALLAFLEQRFDVDPVALDQFFTRGYVLSPRTIFQGVQKLPAGCLLRLDADPERWSWRVEEYWDCQPNESAADGWESPTPSADAEALERIDALLADAVKIRLVSDVPIGCLLSGGIDSSLVTALAAKASGEPVKAFSIGFDESPEFNELPYAKAVAERHHCQWFSRNVRSGDFLASLQDVAPYFDEPFGNFTVTSMRQLAKMTREQLVVVLTGQGGDELAAGYPGRYDWVLQSEAAARSASTRWQYAPAVDDPRGHLGHTSFVPWARAREAIYSPALTEAAMGAAHPLDGVLSFWDRYRGRDRLNRVLYTDVKTNLADYLICIEERMSMSCGLEARNPMLDYRVVEALLALPPSMKVRNGQHKWILYELAKRYVPMEALDRPKRGFSPPMGLWLTQHGAQLAGLMQDAGAPTRGLYSDAWWKYLTAGQYDQAATMPLFYSMMLALWTQNYGKYVANWPTDVSASRAGTLRADGPWQRTIRVEDPVALGTARWFCQMANNFNPGARVLILGDEEGWYTALARRCGLDASLEDTADSRATAGRIKKTYDGLVVVGMAAAAACVARYEEWPALAPAGKLMLFIPVGKPEWEQAQRLYTKLGACFRIQGSQLAELAPGQACMIARFDIPAPVTAEIATAASAQLALHGAPVFKLG